MAQETKRYIVAGHCQKESHSGNKVTVHHDTRPCIVEAVSSDKAFGKSLRIWLKLFPQADGRENHFVHVTELTEKCVVTLENAQLT